MRYRFDDIVLDTERRELQRGGALQALAPQAFDLLLHLIRNRDRAVSKDELSQVIWGGRIVTDAALTTRMNVLRRALGDRRQAQRLLKTLPRLGYRFVGEVIEERPQAAPLRAERQAVRSGALRPTIVVLPFVRRFVDDQLGGLEATLADGVAMALLARSEATVVAYRGNPVVAEGDAVAAGRQLGARYVLCGSVWTEAARTQVGARLTDATTGLHVWGRTYDIARTGMSSSASSMTVVSIAAAVCAQVRNEHLQRVRHARADQLGAWDAYQLGLWHMSASDAANNRLARALFERAVELDPQFGPGYSAIAFTYTAASSAFSELSIAESCERADPLVRRAIGLDEADAEARSRMALLALLRGDLEGAACEAEHAIALNDACPDAWGVKGAALSYAGRRSEGRQAIRRYFSLEPRDIARPIRLAQIASSLYLDGGFEEAAATARQVIRRFPSHPFAYRWLAAALGQLDRVEEAQTVLLSLQGMSPSSFEMYVRQQPPAFCSGEYAPMLAGLRKAGWRE